MSVMSSNFEMAGEMPEFLTSCFKREMRILQETNEMENQETGDIDINEFRGVEPEEPNR